MPSRLARATRVVVGIVAVLTIAGCSSPAPVETPDSTQAEHSATPTATPTEEALQLDPNGTADDNLEFFDAVNQATIDGHDNPIGRDFINGLVNAGFDKDDMQVTEDYSTVGNPAESIQFSVHWGDNCLIGQNGDAVNGYHSAVMPDLATGKCLIGNTAPIDW